MVLHTSQNSETDIFFDIELETDIDFPYSDDSIAQGLNCDVIGQEASHSQDASHLRHHKHTRPGWYRRFLSLLMVLLI